MTILTWSDDFSIGVEEFDEQHKVLINLINALDDAMKQQAEAEILINIMQKLETSTKLHFGLEESLMRVLQYPGYEKHKQEHRQLIHQLTDIKSQFDIKEQPPNYRLIYFLKNWFLDHTLEADQRFGTDVLQKGGKSTFANRAWAQDVSEFFHDWL